MDNIYIIVFVMAGIALFMIIYKLVMKAGKVAAKIPLGYLLAFLIYALLGLFGFLLKGGVSQDPLLLSSIIFMVSLSAGLLLAHNLYENWEWSQSASLGRKLLYILTIALTAAIAFILVFLPAEHRGIPPWPLSGDIVWWLTSPILVMFLPTLMVELHAKWNEIPIIRQIRQVFKLPVGTPPPFIESGGSTIRFDFVIPLEYHSKDVVVSTVAVPVNTPLEQAFHYKLHEHNIVKRFAKKIAVAEENKRSKIYGWVFYRMKKAWWGWFTQKQFLDPKSVSGIEVFNGDKIYVERAKIWT